MENCYFQVPELRGFEVFCLGRPAEEMPRLTNRICGVCPEAHIWRRRKRWTRCTMSSRRRRARNCASCCICAFFVTDHTTHFYALGGPDFVVGPDAPAAERNILGVVAKVGLQIGGQVIATRKRNHEVIKMIGGRAIHPVSAMPGGMSNAITEEQRQEIVEDCPPECRVWPVHDRAVPRGRSRVTGLCGPDHQRRLYPAYLLHGAGGSQQSRQLLRWDGACRRSGRQRVLQIRAQTNTCSILPSMSNPGPT